MKKLTQEEFIKLCQQKYKNLDGTSMYTYEKTIYKGMQDKVIITCPKHGDFEKIPLHFLRKGYMTYCQKCQYELQWGDEGNKFIEKAKSVHIDSEGKPLYDYSKVKYTGSHNDVEIICPVHGSFFQMPYKHANEKHKCPKCAIEQNADNLRLSLEEFIEKSKQIHGENTYDYSKTVFHDIRTKVILTCPKHGDFEILPQQHCYGPLLGCPECRHEEYHGSSKVEREFIDFIKEEISDKIITNDRSFIKPKEIDVLIPDKKLAIEFNGVYYHCEFSQPNKNYHLEKTESCEANGYSLIQVFEDEWKNKKDIVKSILRQRLGTVKEAIYARHCTIKEVSFKDCKEFLEQNHIQGNCSSKVRLGLFHNDELASIMTFGALRKNLGSKAVKGSWELLRFCNKLNTYIIGGASKLLKQFEKIYSPIELISYCDRRLFIGTLYEKLGFSFVRNSGVNYTYLVSTKRENRFKYRKSELIKEGFDSSKTEHEIMLSRGIPRIYDCGCKVFKKTYNNK